MNDGNLSLVFAKLIHIFTCYVTKPDFCIFTVFEKVASETGCIQTHEHPSTILQLAKVFGLDVAVLILAWLNSVRIPLKSLFTGMMQR